MDDKKRHLQVVFLLLLAAWAGIIIPETRGGEKGTGRTGPDLSIEENNLSKPGGENHHVWPIRPVRTFCR